MKATILFTFVCLTFFLSSKEPTKPNVILFVVDDLGWADIGCYGSDLHQTPNIDQLANEGLRFTDAYSSAAVCSPTRASIMSGKYPAKLHMTTITDGGRGRKDKKLLEPEYIRYLNLDEYTLADAMKDAGYTTIHLGKWHLGSEEKYWPENRGFEINIGGWRPGMPIIEEGKSNGYFSPYGNPRLPDGPKGEYLTERLTNEAIRFLEQQKERKKPFFMNFWYYSVHTPIQAKEEKIKKYEALVNSNLHHTNPVYAAMVEHVDESIGRVMQTLKDVGLDDNTIVIFTSDNGGSLGGIRGKNERLKAKITSNFPLRNGKGTMYEGGIRVPFIIRWNNKISRKTNSTPITSCDLYPTILGLTKTIGNKEQNASMDGADLTNVFLDGTSLERNLYWHFPHYNGFGATPYSIIRKGKWKLIEFFEDSVPELYDLESDISEENNLASQYPELVQEMLGDLDNWRDEAKVQMPTHNPDYQP